MQWNEPTLSGEPWRFEVRIPGRGAKEVLQHLKMRAAAGDLIDQWKGERPRTTGQPPIEQPMIISYSPTAVGFLRRQQEIHQAC